MERQWQNAWQSLGRNQSQYGNYQAFRNQQIREHVGDNVYDEARARSGGEIYNPNDPYNRDQAMVRHQEQQSQFAEQNPQAAMEAYTQPASPEVQAQQEQAQQTWANAETPDQKARRLYTERFLPAYQSYMARNPRATRPQIEQWKKEFYYRMQQVATANPNPVRTLADGSITNLTNEQIAAKQGLGGYLGAVGTAAGKAMQNEQTQNMVNAPLSQFTGVWSAPHPTQGEFKPVVKAPGNFRKDPQLDQYP